MDSIKHPYSSESARMQCVLSRSLVEAFQAMTGILAAGLPDAAARELELQFIRPTIGPRSNGKWGNGKGIINN